MGIAGGLVEVCMENWSYVGLLAPGERAKLRSLSLSLERDRGTHVRRRVFCVTVTHTYLHADELDIHIYEMVWTYT